MLKLKWVLVILALLLATMALTLPACTTSVGDEEIRSDVINVLTVDSRIDATNITVEVINGKVILGGIVPSLQQARNVLQTVASLPHISSIEDNLIVQPSNEITDDHIESHISLLFDLVEDFDIARISFSSNSGVVTLTGSVDHLWQKERLEEIILFEQGVKSIVNNVTVIDPTPVSDEQILDEVNTLISIFETPDLTAQVENGVVTLTGSVTYWDEPHILQAIANVHGVVSIRNLAETSVDKLIWGR